jgi:hypothetical protein
MNMKYRHPDKLIIQIIPEYFDSLLAAPAQLATVGSEAAVTIHLRPKGRGDNRKEVSVTASVMAGQRVRQEDMSNTSELLKTP